LNLPARAKVVIALICTGGLLSFSAAIFSVVDGESLSERQMTSMAVLAAVLVASWAWPLVLFRVNGPSEGFQLDEGLFVTMSLLLGSGTAIISFAMAVAAAQVIRRRPLIKSLFNVGQVLIAVGLGVGVVRLIAGDGTRIAPSRVGAEAVGAAAFFLVNTAAVAAIVTAQGTPWRQSVTDGLEIRLLVAGTGVVIALPAAMAASVFAWALPLAILPLVVLRQVLAGHFQARHDRARLTGLLAATLEANRLMDDNEVVASMLASVRMLLRTPEATLGVDGPAADELGVEVRVEGEARWLVAAGRSTQEPFDSSDSSLLEALATVSTGALANAALYQEGLYQRERLSAITASLGEGVCALDADGQITFLNPAAIAMVGDCQDRATDRRSSSRTSPPAGPDFLVGPARSAMDKAHTVRNDDTTFQRADGTPFAVSFTASPIVGPRSQGGAVIAFRDISERKAFEEQLTHQAFYDVLTGLPNRRLFLDHLGHAVLRSRRSGEVHAVLFADVDRFKVTNDSLGHHAGDQLLLAIANRITAVVRPGDMLARFGGDEFTLLLEGVHGVSEALAAAQRLRSCLQAPIALDDGHQVVATLSIGIAITAKGRSSDDVLHDADVAMYQAKAKGRTGHIELFDMDAMGARSAERIELESALRRAVEEHQLEVFYQPVFTSDDHRVVGAEALVRWNHPLRGLLTPGEFIGLAEDTGLILPIGGFVLESACRQISEWRHRFGITPRISINLSARQFQQPQLVENIEHILLLTGVDPGQICLEITEGLAIDDVLRTTTILDRLKRLGASLAIDDFGTGYSSLSYLKQFPVDIVKIDRKFVDHIDTNPVNSAIVTAVLSLAKAVDMTTIAEGVETAAELDHLQSLGCPAIQGFFLSRPLPAAAMEQLLAGQAIDLCDDTHDRTPAGETTG
jgi:diguanylate cyclase (GGDEF)-like protein/PAS domain S-box-containing protein